MPPGSIERMRDIHVLFQWKLTGKSGDPTKGYWQLNEISTEHPGQRYGYCTEGFMTEEGAPSERWNVETPVAPKKAEPKRQIKGERSIRVKLEPSAAAKSAAANEPALSEEEEDLPSVSGDDDEEDDDGDEQLKPVPVKKEATDGGKGGK